MHHTACYYAQASTYLHPLHRPEDDIPGLTHGSTSAYGVVSVCIRCTATLRAADSMLHQHVLMLPTRPTAM